MAQRERETEKEREGEACAVSAQGPDFVLFPAPPDLLGALVARAALVPPYQPAEEEEREQMEQELVRHAIAATYSSSDV